MPLEKANIQDWRHTENNDLVRRGIKPATPVTGCQHSDHYAVEEGKSLGPNLIRFLVQDFQILSLVCNTWLFLGLLNTQCMLFHNFKLYIPFFPYGSLFHIYSFIFINICPDIWFFHQDVTFSSSDTSISSQVTTCHGTSFLSLVFNLFSVTSNGAFFALKKDYTGARFYFASLVTLATVGVLLNPFCVIFDPGVKTWNMTWHLPLDCITCTVSWEAFARPARVRAAQSHLGKISLLTTLRISPDRICFSHFQSGPPKGVLLGNPKHEGYVLKNHLYMCFV